MSSAAASTAASTAGSRSKSWPQLANRRSGPLTKITSSWPLPAPLSPLVSRGSWSFQMLFAERFAGVLAHDTNSQSQFFPALSTAAINPAKVATDGGASAAVGPPAIGPQTGPGFGPQTINQGPQGSAGSGPPQARPEPEPEPEHGHDHDEHNHEHDEAKTSLNGGYISLASTVLILICLFIAQ